MPSVTCIIMGPTRDVGACEIYRCTMPLSYLGRKSQWETRWFFLEDLYHQYMIHGPVVWENLVKKTDIFMFPRTFAPNENVMGAFKSLFNQIKSQGKHSVYETDDDYTNEFRHVVNGNAVQIAQWSDAITVTTPILAKRMSKITSVPSYVLPNMIDPVLWDFEVQRAPNLEGKITIGLTGSPTHVKDWEVLQNPLKEICDKYENVQVVLGGYHPDYLLEVKNILCVPGVKYSDYAHFIKCFDIVLCPVDPDDKFNDGKSPIKAVEAMGARRTVLGKPAGAVAIATNNSVYPLAIKDGYNGFLVSHDEKSWKDCIEKVIVDTELRNSVQINAFKDVYKRFNMSKGWIEWARAYNRILSSPIKLI